MSAYGYEWHQTLIGRIETAQRPLRLNEAVDLAALFGVPVTALMVRTVPDADLPALEQRIADSERTVRALENRHQEAESALRAATAAQQAAAQAARVVESDLATEHGRLVALRHQRDQMIGSREGRPR